MENNDIFKQIAEAIGVEPVSMDEAQQRITDAGIETGYDTLEDFMSDNPDFLIVDAETGNVSLKHLPAPKPARPELPEGKPDEADLARMRDLFVSKIVPNTIKGGKARITAKTATQILSNMGVNEHLEAWGYKDCVDFAMTLLAPYGIEVKMIDTMKGKAERLVFAMPGMEIESEEDTKPVKDKKPGGKKANPEKDVTPTPEPVKVHKISRYFLGHFAYFPGELQGLAAEIAEKAVGDDWFIIDEPGDRPMRLVESILNNNFALAVREILAGRPSPLSIAFDTARFDTGFITAEDRHIVAHFVTNTERDARRFQSWTYSHLTEE